MWPSIYFLLKATRFCEPFSFPVHKWNSILFQCRLGLWFLQHVSISNLSWILVTLFATNNCCFLKFQIIKAPKKQNSYRNRPKESSFYLFLYSSTISCFSLGQYIAACSFNRGSDRALVVALAQLYNFLLRRLSFLSVGLERKLLLPLLSGRHRGGSTQVICLMFFFQYNSIFRAISI